MAHVHPPERIEFPGVVLRRFRERDTDMLCEAVTSSFDHLHPWMPWAAVPPDLETERAFVENAARAWEEGEHFGYGVFDQTETTLLGAIGLHNRIGVGGLEIGYWIHAAHTRRGLATTGGAALTAAAFDLPGIERVEIHCDEANAASAAVPRKLGYRLDRIRDREPRTPGETGREMIWIMVRDAFSGSEAERRGGPRGAWLWRRTRDGDPGNP